MSLDRLHELLAGQALGELDTAERDELVALQREHADIDAEAAADTAERLAASVQMALAESSATELPHALSSALLNQADALLEATAAAPRRSSPGAWAGWLVAAASLVFTVTVLWVAERSGPPHAEARATLLASGADLVRADCSATEDALVQDRGIAGDVVWSAADQTGYVRLENLPANDATQHQYQLWIFDEERSMDYPVSGGVFDVDDSGEVVVRLDPRLAIGKPVLFAVTLERPGGVVVSTRERLLVVAEVKS